MDDISGIGDQQNRQQIAQNIRSVFRHYGRNQAENTDWAELDDCSHNHHGDCIRALHKICERLSFFPD